MKSVQPVDNSLRQVGERHGNFRIWRNDSALVSELLATLLPDPDRLFDQGEVLPSPWQGPGTDKIRMTLLGRSCFLKRYNPVGASYGVRYLFRRSRAVKSWLAAQLFVSRGVSTPEPLLCLEERRYGLLGRSYLLFPYINGETASFFNLWSCLDETQRSQALSTLAEIIGHMHRQKLLHGDLNWRNILATRQCGGFRFWLVDLDGSRLAKPMTAVAAHRDLAHFLRDLDRAGGKAQLRANFVRNWQVHAGLCSAIEPS